MGKNKRRIHSTGDASNDAPSAKSLKVGDVRGNGSIASSSAGLIDDVINSVASQSHTPSFTQSLIATSADDNASITEAALKKTLSDLTVIVEQQRAQLNKIISQLSFVLSFLNITEQDDTGLQATQRIADNIAGGAGVGTGSEAITVGSISTATYASVASVAQLSAQKLPTAIHQQPSRDEIVAAVYIDQNERERRATNIIISGLPVCNDMSDKTLVSQMITKELLLSPDIVHLKRLGRPVTTGPNVQPLLVVLRTAAQASLIMQRAKLLRGSVHEVISEHVYINRHLTPAEARAAYEQRCKKRRATVQRQTRLTSTATAAGMPAASIAMDVVPVLSVLSADAMSAAVLAASPFDDLISLRD